MLWCDGVSADEQLWSQTRAQDRKWQENSCLVQYRFFALSMPCLPVSLCFSPLKSNYKTIKTIKGELQRAVWVVCSDKAPYLQSMLPRRRKIFRVRRIKTHQSSGSSLSFSQRHGKLARDISVTGRGGATIMKYKEHFHLKYTNMTLQGTTARRGKCRWQERNENQESLGRGHGGSVCARVIRQLSVIKLNRGGGGGEVEWQEEEERRLNTNTA